MGHQYGLIDSPFGTAGAPFYTIAPSFASTMVGARGLSFASVHIDAVALAGAEGVRTAL